MRPRVESDSFFHFRYNEAEVVDDGLIVCVKYDSMFSIVVPQHDKKLCGKLLIIIANKFYNED